MNTGKALSMNLHFTPSIDTSWLIIIAILAIILLVLSAISYRHGLIIRGLTFAGFMLALLNPSLIKEERKYVKDTAIIVVDQSYSQNIERRKERTNIALNHLEKQINDMGRFNLRIIYAPKSNETTRETNLFAHIDKAFSDIPPKQRAGVILLSDGQVHDIPKDEDKFKTYGPVHLLLSGHKDEKDRQITITNAPAYGITGKNVTIKYRVEDTKNIQEQYAKVTLTMHSGIEKIFHVPVNNDQYITLPIEHPAQNIFSLETSNIDGEITYTNNKTAIIINGVRESLKVLLVSGKPHIGERTWRDLLTSDPGVDLVHFTILKEPNKIDYTPKNEMSLIAFPFKELFEVKLYDFDLIIFDQYRVNNILPKRYFRNIAHYVKEGGAFLEASGPNFATKHSVYNTAIGNILPARPTGAISNKAFKPKVTKLGHNHPVTKNLVWNNEQTKQGKPEHWGSWLRSIDVTPTSGDVLMEAARGQPLLLLDRVGEGRVAQIASDHIWLWSRGYDGGGPHAELLRRIVHWLMKEPELDEQALNIRIHKNTIIISKQNYENITEEIVTAVLPNSEQITFKLKDNNGRLEYKYNAEQHGVYVFKDKHGYRKFVIIGDINAPEFKDVKTTQKKLEPIIKASLGTIIWLDKTPEPKVILSQNTRRLGGSNWIALKQNNDYTVTRVKDTPIMPEWAILLILLSATLLLWWKEGK